MKQISHNNLTSKKVKEETTSNVANGFSTKLEFRRAHIKEVVTRVLNKFKDLSKFDESAKRIFDVDVVTVVVHKSVKGKHRLAYVEKFYKNLHNNLLKLFTRVYNGTYCCSGYNCTIMHDNVANKDRLIKVPRFEDLVLQHILIEATRPQIDPHISAQAACGIKNRGVSFVSKRVAYFLKRHRGVQCENGKHIDWDKRKLYVAKLDIQKFFESVRPKYVFKYVRKHIKSPFLRTLFKELIYNTDYIVNKTPPDYPIYKDLPLGNVLSSVLSNLMLSHLDFKILKMKPEYRILFYIRYLDDILIVSTNRRCLYNLRQYIERWLANHGLCLNKKSKITILDIHNPLIVSGRYFYRNGIIRIAKRTKKRIINIFKYLKDKICDILSLRVNVTQFIKPLNSLVAYYGIIKHTCTKYLVSKYMGCRSLRKLLRTISNTFPFLHVSTNNTVLDLC